MEDVALCFFRRYFILNAEMGIFFFTPSFRCASLVRLCPSLAHRLEPSRQQGATMCWEGEHLRWSDVDGGGGVGCGVLFIVPQELLSQTQSPYEG